MLKSEAAAYLAGVTQTEGAEASAPTNLHVITGEVGEASADGKTLVKIDGLMFSESDDQFIEVDALGGLEEGDIATIVLTGEQGHAMTPLALGSIGSVDRITVRIAAIEADYIKVEQLDAAVARIGELEADHVSTNDLNAATARIGTLETTRATITDLEAATARIHELEVDHVSIDDFEAEQANIDQLQANTADIGTIRANSAKVQNLTAAQLEADHATVGSLSTNYAHITNGVIDNATIGYADVNNLSAHYAEIQNGKINSALINTAAIVDEQVFTVTGNKATLAQIDASKINVLNLKAKDIEVERINGQPVTNKTLVDALSQHESDISGLDTKIDDEVEALNDRIDGAIETFTGTVVPTLENTPASQWNTVKLKDQHVGDVYYVVNSQSAQNGYCYRFTKSGSTYSWQLIKDSDVTAALSRLQTAEGKIGDIEQFDVTVSSFMTDTDDELSSLKTRATSLETSLGDKVDTSTFNTVSQKVDTNEANITSMSTVLTNNGLSSSTNITNTVNSVKQTADTNTSNISSLQTTVSGHTTTIQQHTTSISQNTDAIALRATKTEVQQVRPAYASSSTAAGTAAKVATIDPAVTGYALYKGATVAVTFSTANTAATPTLNLNSTGAKQIRSYTGTALSEAEYKWAAGSTIDLVYDGTYWRMQDSGAVKRVTAAEASIRVNAENINLKVSKDGVISSINQSAETVKIQASKVEIDGTAIFTAISSDVDDAITDKGYATTTQAQGYATTAKTEAVNAAAADATSKANAAEAAAKAAIPSDISELNNDTGFITSADVPTKVSELTNDSGFQNATQVNTAITSKGYQTSSQVESAITSKGYATTTQAQGYADAVQSNLNASRAWYAECSTAAATVAKVATITPATTDFALTNGVVVNVKFSVTNTGAVGSLTLNVNGTGAKSIKTQRSNSLTNLAHAGILYANVVIPFIYNGQYWLAIENYNSDTYNRTRMQNVITAATAITASHIVCGTSAGYKNIAAGVQFDLSYPLLYASSAIAAAGTGDNNYLQINSINAANNGTIETGTNYSTLYLKGTVAGNLFTIAESPFLTTVQPTTENGFFYIPLGVFYNSTTGIYFNSSKDLYAYLDGRFRQVTPTEIMASQRIYYRSKVSGTVPKPTAWITFATNKYNDTVSVGNGGWSTKVTPIASSTAENVTKYLYLYTCEQRKRLDGTVECTAVTLDENTTIIDGGNVITHTITAEQIDAASINASKSLTVGAMTDAAASTILNSNVVVGGRNLVVASKLSNGYLAGSGSIGGMNATRKEGYSDYIPVSPGESITFQAWVTLVESDGEFLWMAYEFYNSSKTYIGSRPVKYHGTTLADGRIYNSFDGIVVPDGAAYIRVSMRRYDDGVMKVEKGNKATDWTPAPEDQEALALSSGIEYIAGTQAAATNVWTGVTKETALVAGKTIAYHLPFAGTSTAATLTLTLANGSTTAAIGVKYNSNNSAANNVTTHYGAGSVINMTYDGTYWRVSASYYDTTGISYARYRTQNPNYIKAAAACTSGHIICGTSSGYRDVAANVSFDLNYALMWCGKNIAANATGTENYLTYNSINVKTSGTVESATQYSTVYLKGTVDGKTFKIAASPFLTCKVPTSDDGFAYIPLGVAYDTTPSIYFNSSSDVYAFRNGEFQKLDSVAKYITAITDSGIRVHAKTNPTANYAAVDADGMDVVKGGVSVAKFGETARLGVESGYHTEVTSTGMRVSDGTDDVVRIYSEVTQDGVRYGSIDIGKSGDDTLTSVGGSAEDYTEDDYVHHSRSAYLTAMASTDSDGAWVEAWAKRASTWDEDDTGITLRGNQLDLFGPNGEGYGSASMENAGKVISTQSGMVSQSISAAANAVTTYTVTFPNPYDVAPIVVACFYSTSSAAAFGGLSLAVSAITTTSFTVKIFNNTSTGRSPGLFWIATPQTSQ